MEIVQREVFGPVLTWQTFGDDDEAVDARQRRRATGSPATLFTRDERARAAARVAAWSRARCGSTAIFVRDLAAPFGGARESGIGREGGTWSFDFFCDVKNVAIRKGSFGEEAVTWVTSSRAAIVGHQPAIMAPEAAAQSDGRQGRDTTLVEPGYRRLREALDARGADTLVIFDTHWFTTIEHVVAGAARFTGIVHLRRAADADLRPRATTTRARRRSPSSSTAASASERGVRFLNATNRTSRVHYPTLNLVHHLASRRGRCSRRRLPDAPRRTTSSTSAQRSREAVRRTPDARVALLGSGGMSHAFWPMDVILAARRLRARRTSSRRRRVPSTSASSGIWDDGDHAAVLDALSRVPALPSRRALRPLPDAGRRARRPRLPQPAGRAALRLRERRRHRAGPRLVRRRRLKADRREERRMTLAGWTLPQTRHGTRVHRARRPPGTIRATSSPSTSPPTRRRVAELVPAGFSPRGDGSCTFFFCDWCSGGGPRPARQGRPGEGSVQGSLRDPERDLRRPAVRTRAVHLGRFRALAPARADPGLPEEARRHPHDAAGRASGRAARGKHPGERFAAHVSSLGRRLATAAVTLRGNGHRSAPGGRAAAGSHAALAVARRDRAGRARAFDGHGRPTSRSARSGAVQPRWSSAPPSSRSSISSRPRSVGAGWVYPMAFSVTGGTSMPLRGAR